jgi:hypothetical protein
MENCSQPSSTYGKKTFLATVTLTLLVNSLRIDRKQKQVISCTCTTGGAPRQFEGPEVLRPKSFLRGEKLPTYICITIKRPKFGNGP